MTTLAGDLLLLLPGLPLTALVTPESFLPGFPGEVAAGLATLPRLSFLRGEPVLLRLVSTLLVFRSRRGERVVATATEAGCNEKQGEIER